MTMQKRERNISVFNGGNYIETFDKHHRIFLQQKELMIKSVLFDYLGREATEEDAKKCCLVTHSSLPTLSECLTYDGVILGNIELNFSSMSYSTTITFIPLKEDQTNPEP